MTFNGHSSSTDRNHCCAYTNQYHDSLFWCQSSSGWATNSHDLVARSNSFEDNHPQIITSTNHGGQQDDYRWNTCSRYLHITNHIWSASYLSPDLQQSTHSTRAKIKLIPRDDFLWPIVAHQSSWALHTGKSPLRTIPTSIGISSPQANSPQGTICTSSRTLDGILDHSRHCLRSHMYTKNCQSSRRHKEAQLPGTETMPGLPLFECLCSPSFCSCTELSRYHIQLIHETHLFNFGYLVILHVHRGQSTLVYVLCFSPSRLVLHIESFTNWLPQFDESFFESH